jgi:hypothetical protein
MVKLSRGLLRASSVFVLFAAGLSIARQIRPPPKYDEAQLKGNCEKFMESLDALQIAKDYPRAIKNLLAVDSTTQITGLDTLAASGEVNAIPWLISFLDAKDGYVQTHAGLALERIVSSIALKRRDMTKPETVTLKPLAPNDADLRPLAWIVLKMLRATDNPNLPGYAASMTRYLDLRIFEDELQTLLDSPHPAVADQARFALEGLGIPVRRSPATPR